MCGGSQEACHPLLTIIRKSRTSNWWRMTLSLRVSWSARSKNWPHGNLLGRILLHLRGCSLSTVMTCALSIRTHAVQEPPVSYLCYNSFGNQSFSLINSFHQRTDLPYHHIIRNQPHLQRHFFTICADSQQQFSGNHNPRTSWSIEANGSQAV